MIVLGLTGSIAMGKSTAAAMLRSMGVPVHDSDAAVHLLTGPGGLAVPAIEAAFPGSTVDGAVDRRRLGSQVFGDPAALARLEGILHPLVYARTYAFLCREARRRAPVVVLDVPLLFETGGQARCDQVIVVSAPTFLQRARALRRPGMTERKLQGILARQMPDVEKCRRADRVIPTGLGRAATFHALDQAVRLAESATPPAWPPRPFVERRTAQRRP
jgi:dephospho-CoA kinase